MSKIEQITWQQIPELQEFLAKAFKTTTDAPFLNQQLLEWQFCNPVIGASYVMRNDKDILAHVGLVFTKFSRMNGVCIIDWASIVPGGGVFALALVEKELNFDFTYALGMNEYARAMWHSLDYAEYGNSWTARVDTDKVSYIPYEDFKVTPFIGAAKSVPRLCSKDARYFECLEKCPAAKITVHSVSDNVRVVGNFALAVIGSQARIVGVWPIEYSYWELMYHRAVSTAVSIPGVTELFTGGVCNGRHNRFDPIMLVSNMKFAIKIGKSAMVQGKVLLYHTDFQLCDDDMMFLQHELLTT